MEYAEMNFPKVESIKKAIYKKENKSGKKHMSPNEKDKDKLTVDSNLQSEPASRMENNKEKPDLGDSENDHEMSFNSTLMEASQAKTNKPESAISRLNQKSNDRSDS